MSPSSVRSVDTGVGQPSKAMRLVAAKTCAVETNAPHLGHTRRWRELATTATG